MSETPIPGYKPGPFRPGPGAPVPSRPAASSVAPLGADPGTGDGTGHPAVDAALQAITNATDLSPADQIAQYEAAQQIFQETLATIDQS
jgi:hypothetical protein